MRKLLAKILNRITITALLILIQVGYIFLTIFQIVRISPWLSTTFTILSVVIALFIINNFCTIGQFGLFEQDGVVYMRHNIVVNMKDDPERIITDICDYFSLMLSSIQRFVDAIAQIAVGAVNIEVAKEMDLIPNI